MSGRNGRTVLSERQRKIAEVSTKGAFWAFAAKYSGKALNLVMVTVLARLLTQADFGVAAYALVVVAFFEVTGLGVGPSLIYHESDDRGRATGFWMATVAGFALLGLAWLGAPLVGAYFNDDRAIDVVRVLAFSFPIIGLGAVPEAVLLKSLNFRRAFLPGVAMSLVKVVTAIVLAVMGFGPWALIYAQLAGAATQMVLFWFMLEEPWRPTFVFDRGFAKVLGHYSVNIMGIHFLGIWLLNVDYLLVGRYLGAAALGVYVVAFRIPELLIKELYGVLSRVLFPIYTRLRDDLPALGVAFLKTNRYVATLTIPMAVGLWLVAEPLVLVIFGERWLAAVGVIGPIAVYSMLRSLYFNAGSIYKSIGRPSLLTKLNTLTAAVLTPVLYLSVTEYGSLPAVAWTHVVVTAVVGLFQLGVATRVLGVSPTHLAAALRGPVGATAVMAVAAWSAMTLVGDGPWPQLLAGVVAGAGTYLIVLLAFQRPFLNEAMAVARAGLGKA